MPRTQTESLQSDSVRNFVGQEMRISAHMLHVQMPRRTHYALIAEYATERGRSVFWSTYPRGLCACPRTSSCPITYGGGVEGRKAVVHSVRIVRQVRDGHMFTRIYSLKTK